MISNYKDKHYIVIGTGRSGIAASKLLLSAGATVVLYDDNVDIDKDALINKIGESDRLTICAGSISSDIADLVDEVVVSPGVPLDCQTVLGWKERGLRIIGEIELATEFEKGDVVAITGTNGKTTTTSLVGQIMKKKYQKVCVAGNIGFPYTETVTESYEESCSVLEVSSFQLETICTFAPKVSAILNITPDHLNRHHNMDNYIDAKFNIAINQTENDIIVLNYEDEILRNKAETLKPRVIYFSSKRVLEDGVFLSEDMNIVSRINGEEYIICNVDEIILPGVHNYENIMAAVAMSYAMGVSYEDIRDAVMSFKSVPHRIEYVCEKDGVIYYNDSKGTNPDAAIKGIQAMTRPTYLIGGGYNKDSEFDEWIEAFDGKVVKLVLIGETADIIAKTCDKHGFNDYVIMDSLLEAVEFCNQEAVNGEAVLLSPACASWDMFKSFEERGDLFKQYVTGEEN